MKGLMGRGKEWKEQEERKLRYSRDWAMEASENRPRKREEDCCLSWACLEGKQDISVLGQNGDRSLITGWWPGEAGS